MTLKLYILLEVCLCAMLPLSRIYALLFTSLVCLCSTSAVKQQQSHTPNHQPPLGLSLGPQFITVAQVFDNTSTLPIVQIEGSKFYQVWFADIARHMKITRSVAITSA